jgi:hypothetical protein
VSGDSGVPVCENRQIRDRYTSEHRASLALFVSTGLASWPTDQPHRFARDVQIDDTAYRRLDPEYYAWLRSKMNLAKMAASAGQIEPEAYNALRSRFNATHEWAMEHFGERALAEAVRGLDARDYRPPVAEPEQPPAGMERASAGGSPAIVDLVDAIAEAALALGWRRDRLYAAGTGIFDPRRGLMCYLKPGDRIGEVTAQSIEIVHPIPSEVRHRFYNPDVEQPWIKKIGATAKRDENSPSAAGISR